ncbi:diamine N-acetyltransferase [Bacillus oleivorans]|uniref:Diamine N-acetyltransferase n=1 Tax=Bacillus oleivorans TaxID=1448271 RepID=A0A285D521_9BACI|nr:GNAT family N-acetyltransferase [Bacillus oleivorans]SNX74897.1 diamine N-acetyltransferase [Bacillus oleivorans]
MNVQLKVVTRDNWEEALQLKVSEKQSQFVPSVAVSLAKVYIKPDGENVNYIPFAIYDYTKMVGFIMHAYEEETSDMYWINGFLIDEKYQGQGYGRAALTEMVKWIVNEFPHCEEIRLTVYKENHNAQELYKSFGFQPTGVIYGEEDVWRFTIRK